MDFQYLSCVDDDLPPAMLRRREKMEKALWLLKDSLGSGCFLAQFWYEDRFVLENLSYPHRASQILRYSDIVNWRVGKSFHIMKFWVGCGISGVDFQNGLRM
jgi:hypothetical protein